MDEQNGARILTGGCMCGDVRYEISAEPLMTGLCHCTRCQPQSGSAFSVVVFYPREGVVIHGATAFMDDIGTSGLSVKRRYCPNCGSPLTTEPDLTPTLLMVKAGTLDKTDWLKPTFELFVGRRQAWVTPLDGAIQYQGNPPV